MMQSLFLSPRSQHMSPLTFGEIFFLYFGGRVLCFGLKCENFQPKHLRVLGSQAEGILLFQTVRVSTHLSFNGAAPSSQTPPAEEQLSLSSSRDEC